MSSMSPTAHPAELPEIDVEEVDRLLGEGRALPPVFYTHPALAELEDRMIFRTSWQLACSELELKEPGDFVTLTLSSVPIVVIRDGEHRVRAFVNVCRHRAGRVVADAKGHCKRMQCQYHGWTYNLDGSLQGAPAFAEGLPPFETLGLRTVEVDSWAGFVFVALEPKQSLEAQLGEVPRTMEENGYDFPFAEGKLEYAGDYELDVNANWKLYHENNSECYHCPTTHTDTFSRILKTRDVKAKALVGGSLAQIPLSEELIALSGSDDARNKDGYTQYILWPNGYVITGHVGDYWFRVDPDGPKNVHVVGRDYQRPGQQPQEMTELLDECNRGTILEDKGMVEDVQIGLESGYYDAGPILPVAEVLLRDMQHSVWNALRPAFA